MMINRTILVGRLTKDPVLRQTGSGIFVAQFTLAVNRAYKNKDGERDADFISCVIWRKAAQNFTKFTSKGSLVGIDGRIQTRTYDDKDGKRVYVTEVIVADFSLLDYRKDDSDKNTNATTAGSSTNTQNTNTNTSQGQSTTPDPVPPDDSIDISDDDLPF